MKSKKILTLISVLTITCSLLISCNMPQKTTNSSNKTIQELADSGNVKDLETKINIKDDKDTVTQNVNSLTTAMYNLSGKYNYFTQIFADNLKETTDNLKDGQDILDDNVIKNTQSKIIKGFLQDCKENNLKISYDKNSFYVKPDINHILQKYGDSIDEKLKDVLTFRNEEDSNSVFNSTTGTFDMDLLESRIIDIENKISEDDNSSYYKDWLSYLEYYYDSLFGYSHSLYVKDQKTQEIYTDTIDQYKKIISDNPDSQLAKDLQGYVSLLETNNKCRNDKTQKYLSDLFSKKFATLSSNNYEQNQSQSQEQEQEQTQTQSQTQFQK